MNTGERKMAISTLVDQQVTFIMKFRELFKDEDGSPHAQNQLPIQRLQILLTIKQFPGITQADLARRLLISPAAVGRHVKDLRKTYNLVKLELSMANEKEKLCYLSPRGEAIMEEMFSVFFPRRA